MLIPITAAAFVTRPVYTFGTVDLTVGDNFSERGYRELVYGSISADSLIEQDGEAGLVFRISTRKSDGLNVVELRFSEERFANQALEALQATYTRLEAGTSGTFINVSDLSVGGKDIQGNQASPGYSFTAGDEGSTFTMSWA